MINLDMALSILLAGGNEANGASGAALEDRLLVEGLRLGDENAYEQLVTRFERPVYTLVYRLLSDPSEAADVVQEVFLKVFRKVDSFRGDCSLKTWIYRIAVHEAYNQRRWFQRHRRQETALEATEEADVNYVDVLPDPGRSPFDVTLDHETREQIEYALQRVNPRFRAAVVLRDIEEMSYEEIATVLQTNLGTVKSRILRGREALRRELTVLQNAAESSALGGLAPQTAGGNS
jgi:RNA polymerase sigma-70 factor (ECF subfamily)